MHKIPLERWNQSFFRPWERPAAIWLAACMPAWVTPDLLSAVGVAGAVVIFLGYAFSGSHPALLWVATLGLAINWFGDSLDGGVARHRKIERPRYGYFLDNALDCIAALLLALGMGLSGYVRFDICLLALSGYLMMSALTFLRASVSGVFQISYGAVGPTEIRIAFAALNLLLIVVPPSPFQLMGITVKYPDLMALAWCALLFGTFVLCTAKQARHLAADEPAPQRTPSRDLADLGDKVGTLTAPQRGVRVSR